MAQTHSPPEREKTTTTHQLLEHYQSNVNGEFLPSYVDTEDKPIVNVNTNSNNNHERYSAISYENTISTYQADNVSPLPIMPTVIH